MDYIQLETNVDVEKYATVIENIRVYSDLENANMIVWGNYLENNQKKEFLHKYRFQPNCQYRSNYFALCGKD